VLEEPAAQAMRHAIWVCLQLGGPPLLAMLLVGVVISLIQTVTQIQESTLAFLPNVPGMAAFADLGLVMCRRAGLIDADMTIDPDLVVDDLLQHVASFRVDVRLHFAVA
jgi:flagellar biosynthetic protein FliQ